MRVIQYRLLIFLFAITYVGCSKSSSSGGGSGGGGGGTVVKEENLVIAIDPDPGNTLAQSLGANYPFNILVQSKMPSLGVTIDINCKKELDNSVVFSQTLQSTIATVAATINNLPFNESTIVTITVTSKSTATNTVSKTFRLIKK